MSKLTIAIAVIAIGLYAIWRVTRRKAPSTKNADVYVCPTCGSRHCDCYKKTE